MSSMHCYGRLLLFIFVFSLVSCLPTNNPPAEDEVKEIFHGSKRDTSGSVTTPLLKSPLFNPLLNPLFYPPGKPLLFPPLSPSDILLSRFAKASAAAPASDSADPSSPANPPPNPALIGSYFKAKKDEFLAKLFEKITATTETPESPEISARAVDPEDPAAPNPAVTNPSSLPVIDPSFFLSKKFDFLNKLFQAINATATPATPTEVVTDESGLAVPATTTLKPTIVPPSFWFPFPKPPKPPKPSKAPKPPKPIKPKKVLEDALDTLLLQSLLVNLGVDPTDATLAKRAVAYKKAVTVPPPKKTKAKKPFPFEEITEYQIPEKIDPEFYSSKASAFLDKLFKALNKTDVEDVTSSNYVSPKATVIPLNFWTKPSDTEYTSKLDAFLDLLTKSLNATDGVVSDAASAPVKPGKSKPIKKINKRASFLDELLHRVPPSTTTEKPKDGCDCKPDTSDCCCDGKCGKSEEKTESSVEESSKSESSVEESSKSERSLIFKPFGTGLWIPQYLYAARMGLYLDKLMDTINTAAADDLSDSPSLKRSVPTDADLADLPPRDAAVNLIISELTELKDGIIEAFADGLKAQKLAATPKPKPAFGPAAGKFKKPTVWGPKPSPTPDPVEQIQKRIDLINDVFDKLTKVEKTLLFSDDPDDPKTIKNITQLLKADEPTEPTPKSSKKAKPTVVPADFWAPDPTAAEADPNYYVVKTQEFLKSLYQSKLDDLSAGSEE